LALQYVPLVVEVCTQVVEERGLANQGIYRVPGNSLAINNLVEDLNRVSNAAWFNRNYCISDAVYIYCLSNVWVDLL